MKLYCVRHGEAVNAFENPERPLTLQGKEDIKILARSLASHGVQINHLIHSRRLRASQTAEILADALKPQKITEAKTGFDENDSIEDALEMIQHWQDDTMLVGHMPFMSHLVSALVVKNAHQTLVNYRPGTVVILEYSAGEGCWMIGGVVSPSMIR